MSRYKLDSRIEANGYGLFRDLVDTEPSNGNILKMLFGAINEKFDDDVISPISSRNSAALPP